MPRVQAGLAGVGDLDDAAFARLDEWPHRPDRDVVG
jgi:hypothetical protein